MKRAVKGSWWQSSWPYEKGVRLIYGDPYCLLCVVDRFGKPGRKWLELPLYPPDGASHWQLIEWGSEMLLRKDSQAKAVDTSSATLIDVKAQKQWPTLWSYMTQSRWDDDTPRATSGLTIFVQDGLFKVLLKENEQSLCLWAAGIGLYPALDAIEAALCTPAPDWRTDRRAGGGVAKKGRK